MTADAENLPDLARSIRDANDAPATRVAAEKLIAIADAISAPAWRDEHRDAFRSLNGAVATTSTPEDLEQALGAWQSEILTPVYAAMDLIGGERIVDYAMREAGDGTLPVERRLLGLAVLLHNVDRSDAPRTSRVASILVELDRLAAEEQAARLARENIAHTLEGMTGDIRTCADDAARADPNLDSSGLLVLAVATDGTVSEASTKGLAPDRLARCVTQAARKVRFKPLDTGGGFTVRIPMSFHGPRSSAVE